MERAREAVDEARLLLEANHANTSVNRLYYACFYAVSALLLTEGHASAKHSGVRALFDQHWVKSGRVPVKLGRIYRRLFMRRQRSDYGDLVQFSEEDVRAWLGETEEFVTAITRMVQERLTPHTPTASPPRLAGVPACSPQYGRAHDACAAW